MKIKEFYVVPETKEEHQFVEEDIKFFLDISLRSDSELTIIKYEELIISRFNEWRINNGNF
jgi:hypothetical protein